MAFASFPSRPSAFGAMSATGRLGGRRRRAVRLSRAVFPCAAFRAAGRSRPVESTLWPLLIVLFSSLLPGERLARHHIIGALLGLAGTVLLFAGNAAAGFAPGQILRSGRSLPRRLRVGGLFRDVAPAKAVPTDAVAGFCLGDRATRRGLSTAWSRRPVRPETHGAMARHDRARGRSGGRGVLCLDIGMKRGDIRVLGAASYATPLLSTAFLILAGFAQQPRRLRSPRS